MQGKSVPDLSGMPTLSVLIRGLEDQFHGFLISENCFHHAAVYPQCGAIGGRREFAG
jgi:hypothetical protein